MRHIAKPPAVVPGTPLLGEELVITIDGVATCVKITREHPQGERPGPNGPEVFHYVHATAFHANGTTEPVSFALEDHMPAGFRGASRS